MENAILVAGGAGFIGSHVCKALARNGYLPVVYDDLSGGWADAVKWGPLVEGGLNDPIKLDAVFREFRPSAVVHLAGLIAAGESVEHPAKYYGANMLGAYGLLSAMVRWNVMPIVFSSSAAVYGEADTSPISEGAPIQPTNPYGRTKAMTEAMLQDFTTYGMRSVSLRYFNAAGADPGGQLGERHEPETHLIPLALEAAAGLGPQLSLFGTDHPTHDGTCVRDYVHVSDLADAHVLALESLLADGEQHGKGRAHAFNLGSGSGFSVFEVIGAVDRVTGMRTPYRTCARRPGDPARLVADSRLAERELGWVRRYPRIDDQIRHAWAFLQARRGGKAALAG